MSRTAARRALLTVVLSALCLTVTYAVVAASGPSDHPPSPRRRHPPHRRRRLHRRHQDHRPHHPVPQLRRAKYNYAFGKDIALPPLERHVGQRPVPRSQKLPHRRILRPLPPGSLPPVAPVRPRQRLPRALVPQKRQHAHRRKGRPVLPPLRGLPQPVALLSGAPDQGLAQKTPLRRGRRHLLRLPLPSRRSTPAAPAATSWRSPQYWSTKTAQPITARSPTRRSSRTSTATPKP